MIQVLDTLALRDRLATAQLSELIKLGLTNVLPKQTSLSDDRHPKRLTTTRLSVYNKQTNAVRDNVMEKPSTPRNKGLLKRSLGQTLEIAELARDTASAAARGLAGTAGDTARGLAGSAGDAALKLAQTYLSKRSITLPLPEPLLNHQIRQRLENNSNIDHISIDCGNDQLKVLVDGHYLRVVYTVELHFVVTRCVVNEQERSLYLQQIDENLDAQLRQANFAVNWVARQASRHAFRLANKLPLPSLAQHVIKDIPGIHADGHRRWRIDLDEAGLIDFIENRTWMLEKLAGLTDFSILPGLNVLHESRELMQQLVSQLEVRGLRVQPNRLEVSVGISKS